MRRGFRVLNGHYPFLVESSQDSVMWGDGTAGSITELRQATSARQAAEWGDASFSRNLSTTNG